MPLLSFIKITVYSQSGIVSFFDDVNTKRFWIDYFLGELKSKAIHSFIITSER